MKTRFSFAAVIILLCSALFSDTKKYSITTHEKDSDIKLEFSREYFINNIYLDFMAPFGLDIVFSDSDYVQIFNELCRDLSVNYQKRIVIPVTGNKTLSILFKSMPLKNDMSIVVVSNYDIAKKQFVPDDGDFSGCYSKQYFIVEKSLVPGKIFYLKNRDEALKKFRDTSDYNGLADFYLFDTDKTNDKDIPGIIASGLKNSPGAYNSCLLKLTESQYHIFNRKFGAADLSLKDAEKLSASITDPGQKKFIEVSIKLMRRVLYISRNVQLT